MYFSIWTGSSKDKEAKSKTIFSHLKSNFIWSKIFKWEYWPFSVFYAPIFFYWVWISIRARSLFFFTSSNPSIEFGGMLGESKDKIFQLIPDQYIPETLKLSKSIKKEELLQTMTQIGITYPFILKPDIGERGWMVRLIKKEEELTAYLKEIKVDFLIQEYVPYELELGVFYYRYPDSNHGTVSSVVIKDTLKVTGDGFKSVVELIEESPRAKMQLKRLLEEDPEKMKTIPDFGKTIELVPIGNHCLGTTFLNGNHIINDELTKTFDQVSKQIEGFYFGRYDIRCKSIESLCQGTDFKILELNGAGAEPAHIYQPGFPLIQAYKAIIAHLKVLVEISIMNKEMNGVGFATFKEGLKEVKKILAYNKNKY